MHYIQSKTNPHAFWHVEKGWIAQSADVAFTASLFTPAKKVKTTLPSDGKWVEHRDFEALSKSLTLNKLGRTQALGMFENSPMSKDEYIASHLACCPICRENGELFQPHFEPPAHVEGNFIEQATCNICQSSWENVFAFDSFNILAVGPRALSAKGLGKLYQKDPFGHPAFPKTLWREHVGDGRTELGYDEWLFNQLLQAPKG